MIDRMGAIVAQAERRREGRGCGGRARRDPPHPGGRRRRRVVVQGPPRQPRRLRFLGRASQRQRRLPPRGRVVDLDRDDPLHPVEAAPAGHHQPQRRAVPVVERLAGDVRREQQIARVGAARSAARSPSRRPRAPRRPGGRRRPRRAARRAARPSTAARVNQPPVQSSVTSRVAVGRPARSCARPGRAAGRRGRGPRAATTPGRSARGGRSARRRSGTPRRASRARASR